MEECNAGEQLAAALAAVEGQFFSETHAEKQKTGNKPWLWNTGTLTAVFEAQGFTVRTEIIGQNEERVINDKDLAALFDTENSRWGTFFSAALSPKDFSQVKELLAQRIQQGPLPWKWESVLVTAHCPPPHFA